PVILGHLDSLCFVVGLARPLHCNTNLCKCQRYSSRARTSSSSAAITERRRLSQRSPFHWKRCVVEAINSPPPLEEGRVGAATPMKVSPAGLDSSASGPATPVIEAPISACSN